MVKPSPSTLRCDASAAHFSDELADALHGDFDLLEGGRVTATHEAFAAGSEGGPGTQATFFFSSRPIENSWLVRPVLVICEKT